MITHPKSPSFMSHALIAARHAFAMDEVPVGAVIVSNDGTIVAHACNQTEASNDPTAHAEMLAIRLACAKLGSARLSACDMYVTLEPCAMCAQAIAFARLRRLYFGAYDPKGGGVEHGACIFAQPTCHHRPEVVGGVEEEACGQILKKFFADKR